MTTEKLNRLWLLATGLIILIIIVSGSVIFIKRDNGKPLSVSVSQNPQFSGQIHIDGAVVRPGAYAYGPNDSLSSLLEASGGLQSGSDLAALQLHVPSSTIPPGLQKVDINRAERWLLQALPGIGEVKAQSILDYRTKLGHFNNIEELTEVPGISSSVYDKIKDYITTGEQ